MTQRFAAVPCRVVRRVSDSPSKGTPGGGDVHRSNHSTLRRCGAALLSVLVIAGCAAAKGATGSHPSSPRASGATKPNIVVIEIDDMRYDELPYLPKTLALLPGLQFSRAYVSTSLCCPSRAAFLSGQYVQNHKVFNNNAYGNFNHNNTIATWLSASGYFTSEIGKYMNGYTCAKARPSGWTHWQALCANVYGMFKYGINDNGVVRSYGSAAADYQTKVLGDRAVATVAEGAASGKPYFLWVTPVAPHSGSGSRVEAKYATDYSTWQLPKHADFNEADVADKPAWVRAIPKISNAKVDSIRKSEVVRLRMLRSVDDLVERTVQAVEAQGHLSNTMFVITSDNGFMRGEHRVPSGKEVMYQSSMQIPLLLSGPGIPIGTSDALVLNTDVPATIAEWAQATAGRTVDGRSLTPLVTDAHAFDHRVSFHSQVPDPTNPQHPGGFGLQADQFSYFELDTGEKELYDRSVDPYETTNVVAVPQYAPVVAQLATILHGLTSCSGASCAVTRPDLAPQLGSVSVTCSATVPTCDVATGVASDADGTIVSYVWDFGDGTSASGRTAHHVYATDGDYTVTLTVTDSAGTTAVATRPIHAGLPPNQPPTAAASVTVTGTTADFDASASTDADGTIVSYDWDFGDGSTGSGATPAHDYGAPGSWTATVTVTDDRGGADAATVAVDIPAAPPGDGP